jgi:excisionase family DNA binding protein
MTAPEAAKKLEVTIDFIYRLIHAGVLTATKKERGYDISEASVNARIKSLELRRKRIVANRKEMIDA